MSTDLRTSLVRTVVPIVAGWIIAAAVHADIHLDPALVQTVVTAVYYASVRFAEERWPQIGWLLGTPKTPAY